MENMENKFLSALKQIFVSNPLSSAKIFIPLTALLTLILSDTQIKTIVVLNNELCSFVLFMFVLLGLACIFNALRVKPGFSKYGLFSIFLLLATIALGIILLVVYYDALKNQPAMDEGMIKAVNKGISHIYLFLSIYLLGTIQTIRGILFQKQ